jgi:signal transduction histidine kinase
MTWSMSIRDTGQGIPETWQHLIFDEFRQVDGTSKRKHGGTGLGLSIVKKLCLLMGGTVTVNSKLNEGSTFTVTLPLEVAAEIEKQPA